MSTIMRRLQPFWLALTFLTTLPGKRFVHTPAEAADQGRSVACYPLVGLLVGVVLALLAAFVFDTAAPVGAALLVAIWVALTGALHLDGLADCCDALAAGHGDTERVLKVMKDPNCGVIAVTVLALVLLLQFASVLTAGAAAAGLLLAALVMARIAAAVFMLITDYCRDGGIATAQAEHVPSRGVTIVSVVLGIAGLVVVAPGVWLVLAGVTAIVTLLWRSMWQRRLGGYTGDVVGGLITCVETTVLVVGALLV